MILMFVNNLISVLADALPRYVDERRIINQLVELPQLLDDLTHLAGRLRRSCRNVCRLTPHVLTVGNAAHRRIMPGAAIPAVHRDGLAELLPCGIQHGLHQCLDVLPCRCRHRAAIPARKFTHFEILHTLKNLDTLIITTSTVTAMTIQNTHFSPCTHAGRFLPVADAAAGA